MYNYNFATDSELTISFCLSTEETSAWLLPLAECLRPVTKD